MRIPCTCALLICVALLAVGCVTVPTGPSVMVMPGSQTSFEQFQFDDQSCRGFALSQSGVSSEDAAAESGIMSAAVGTAVGAAAGVAIGAATGDPGAGAAIGAASGLLFGSAVGLDRGTAKHKLKTRGTIFLVDAAHCLLFDRTSI